MTEQTAEQATEQQPTQSQAGQQAAAPEKAAEKPPWGDAANFDAEKAWKLIQDLRVQKNAPEVQRELESLRSRVKDAEPKLAEYDRLVEASKTELEKAQEVAGKVAPLEAENLRLRVALEKGLTGDKAGLITRLQGETREELAADADQLLSMFATPAGPEAAATQTPKPNPAQGASASGTPSPAEEAAQAAASGNWRESIRLKSQQLTQARELAQ